jgi:hypothetical protein
MIFYCRKEGMVMYVVLYMLGLIAIFIIGVRIGWHISHDKPVGTLRIDHSEPEEAPLMFLELATDPRSIMSKKQVVLDVSTESYLSHK